MSDALEVVLTRARTVGFLGPGPIRAHIDHAERYLEALVGTMGSVLDLGSGGGIPGLPILVARTDLEGMLVDASTKRCAFLTWAVTELGLAGRVNVQVGRAEELGHLDTLRGAYDAVVARSFGPPSATLENGRCFLRDGGRLIIAEPPGGRSWSSSVLQRLALEEVRSSPTVAVFRALRGPPADFPRPHNLQRRSPLV